MWKLILEPRNSRPQERPLEVAMADQIPAEPRAGTWNLGVEIGWGRGGLELASFIGFSGFICYVKSPSKRNCQVPDPIFKGFWTWNFEIASGEV